MNCTIATWWSRARQPAPDSVLGLALAQGRPAWGELIHVMWSVWVFVVPMFSPYGYDLRWALLTLLSYPVFLALFCGELLWPRRRAPWVSPSRSFTTSIRVLSRRRGFRATTPRPTGRAGWPTSTGQRRCD